MSDIQKLTEAMSVVKGHLQAEQNATTRELGMTNGAVKGLQDSVKTLQDSVTSVQDSVKSVHDSVKGLGQSVSNLQARSVSKEASMVALGGTFTSIERILITVLGDHDRLAIVEKENSDLRQMLTSVVHRVEALEKRAS